MCSHGSSLRLILCLVVFFAVPAQAQWAVVDVGAITQLVQQVATMRDQLSTMRNQLDETRNTYRSMTGSRGMGQLLSSQPRNYLPQDWAQLEAAMRQGIGNYGALASQLNALMNANAVLTPAQLGVFSVRDREQVEAARRSIAMLQALMREALSTTSGRFAAIEQLIGAISSANDQKAILDLQARIAAEESMLQNEQTKLQVLYQIAQAEELARLQRNREQAIVDVGSLRRLPAMGL